MIQQPDGYNAKADRRSSKCPNCGRLRIYCRCGRKQKRSTSSYQPRSKPDLSRILGSSADRIVATPAPSAQCAVSVAAVDEVARVVKVTVRRDDAVVDYNIIGGTPAALALIKIAGTPETENRMYGRAGALLPVSQVKQWAETYCGS